MSGNSTVTSLLIPFPESKARCAKALGQRKQPQTTTLCAQLAKLLARGLYTPRRRAPAPCTYPRNEATPPHRRFTSPLSFRYLLPGETHLAPKRPHSFQPLYADKILSLRRDSCTRYFTVAVSFAFLIPMLNGYLGPCSKKRGPVNLRRLGKPRQRYRVHALIVCLALAGEIHLFSVEVFHHHETSASIWSAAREGATHLHASQDISPFCPVCQMLRSNSVRPAARTLPWKPHRETPYFLTTCEARYSLNLAPTLVARSPPLS